MITIEEKYSEHLNRIFKSNGIRDVHSAVARRSDLLSIGKKISKGRHIGRAPGFHS